ncbi:AraC family transcriptional regulator [Paenibacillus nanensis]|nr:AraC family transcriptional regulator [Paenibacillus nanensis]
MTNRTVRLLSGEQYFSEKLSIFVNRNAESYELTEHHHDFLEFSCVAEGSGTHHAGGEANAVTPGDLFIIPMGVSHVFRPSSSAKNAPLIVYNCIVTMEAAHELLSGVPGGEELRQLLSMPGIFQAKDRSGEAHRLFSAMHREYAAERPGRQAALHAGLLQLFVFFSRLQQGADEGMDMPITNGMDEVMDWLRRHYADPFAVEELACRIGVGERQFQRLFAKHAGMNITQYVQRLRIEAACRLLLSTDRKVGDIAESVGYSHMPFFNSLFKKHIGLTPRAYRKSAVHR